ncbi:hypothetical protein LEP48_02750 [Isoptericola sp. NEAU-Y5]|uniref:Uncharacterized protein n=1 Tax=Isoptericola luteus TaxID=2879484 RepID=A0ABS7ZF97_9MICO|nr:hypothetical protein [Isoptericola sp. NEAU-Y5]MCA5892269.1 hypothetical protein [Isoptericola sp. NEAU-Y5]
MPTAHERIQVTRDQRVENILALGARRFPDQRPGRVLVGLANERADQLAREAGYPLDTIPVFRSPGRTVTREMVADALDDDE